MLKIIKKILYVGLVGSSIQHAYALQALEEDHLSEVSGQDGITMIVDTDITVNRFIWKDNDGLQPVNGHNFNINSPSQGLLILGDTLTPMKINGGITTIKIDADGEDSGTLNVNIKLPDRFKIETGDIYVAERNVNTSSLIQTKIMNNMSIDLGGLELNIQLGASPQGDLAKVYGTVNNGIRVSNLGILDGNGNDVIGISEVAITDSGGSNFTFNGAAVNIAPNGLHVTPSTGKMIDVAMSDFKLGSNHQNMGGMFMSGLVLGGNNLVISGH